MPLEKVVEHVAQPQREQVNVFQRVGLGLDGVERKLTIEECACGLHDKPLEIPSRLSAAFKVAAHI